MRTSSLTFDFAAATDIGCRRSNNEDSFGYDAERQLFVVCDGMGGSAAGEVASSMAVRSFIEAYDAQDGGAADQPTHERLLQAIVEANRKVRAAAAADPNLDSMGTTLVCACLDGDRAVIGNVGDSRAYLVREGTCIQITQDHSFLDEQVRKGNITPEMAAASDLQSVITRAIGAADTVEPDLFAAYIQPGDIMLLASDGLTRYASPEDIVAATAANPGPLPDTCSALIEHAKRGGGADNITCIVLRAVAVSGSDGGGGIEAGALAT